MSASENPLNLDESASLSELDVLKSRARMMGIEFSNNIGVDTLRERINEHLQAETLRDQGPDLEPEEEPATENKLSPRQQMMAEQLRLVRVRITNMDPKKKDLHGEILTVANRMIGTVRKFVPFGAATENGYHIPFCIYNMMKEREFLYIRSFVDPQTRQLRQETKYVKEFAIEVLEPLTPAELRKLAISQMNAGGNDTE